MEMEEIIVVKNGLSVIEKTIRWEIDNFGILLKYDHLLKANKFEFTVRNENDMKKVITYWIAGLTYNTSETDRQKTLVFSLRMGVDHPPPEAQVELEARFESSNGVKVFEIKKATFRFIAGYHRCFAVEGFNYENQEIPSIVDDGKLIGILNFKFMAVRKPIYYIQQLQSSSSEADSDDDESERPLKRQRHNSDTSGDSPT